MKFEELKVEQLKKELAKLEQTTTGNKAELQKRLMEALRQRGIDIATHDFEDKD